MPFGSICGSHGPLRVLGQRQMRTIVDLRMEDVRGYNAHKREALCQKDEIVCAIQRGGKVARHQIVILRVQYQRFESPGSWQSTSS